uniref:ABC transporter domain-containing protein n=1 Tax=Castor canadensis TaxID=51338 RepID=A0A8C0ZP46_CASCN
MAVLKKLKLLLWKNFILKKRKTLVTVLEILTPLLFSAVILYLRLNSMPKKRSATTYHPIDVSSLPEFFHNFPLKNRFQLVYIPSKSETLKTLTEMMIRSVLVITMPITVPVLGFSSVPLFESYIIKDPNSFYVLVGIVFDHNFHDSNEPLPLEVKYSLRFSYIRRNFASLRNVFFQDGSEGWCTSLLYPPNLSQEPREFTDADGGSPGYNKEGFLAIQHALDKAIMRHHAQNATDMLESLTVLLQRFPYGPHIQDKFFVVLQNEFPLFLMLSFICIELIIVNSISLEKERKLKEYMCMMGLDSWLHWVAWFITFFISVSIAVFIMTILFCTKVHISSPDCLVGNTCPPSFITGTGIQWRNMGSISREFSFTQVLLMLLLDSLLYCAITCYVESIFPGSYGTPKPWYFFAMPSYWFKKPVPVTQALLDMEDTEKTLKSKFIQEEPTDLIRGIEIQHLYKVFYRGRSKLIAVRDLSMNMYRGQITVFLGHNGAGKTTICSMLTGLIVPSSGKALISGYEISKDMVQIRKSMGWCPQHDILFDNFTVAEHLFFYAQLKGLSAQKCPEEVKHMLHLLSLEDKRGSRSKFLSEGMKRKLSIGIALIAGSKLLILDEPTSGMDAISRRAIWDLLQQQKSDRTILLTTHFMDEADLLGDRIAIMAKGELQCCGSSLFLKQKYGTGYYMTLLKTPCCDTEKLCHLIYHHIPNAILESNVAEELIYILPKDSIHRFESLFTDLELRQTELGISTFGASVTSMEEEGLMESCMQTTQWCMETARSECGQEHRRSDFIQSGNICLFTGTCSLFVNIIDDIFNYFLAVLGLNSGLLCQQFYAMLLKRVTYSWRNWMLMLSVQILVPLVIIMLSLMFFKTKSIESIPLELTLKTYGQTIVPFFVSQNSSLDPQLSDNFANMLVDEGQIPLQVPGPIQEFLLKKAKEEPEEFDSLYVVAASFEDVDNHTIVTALFNNQAYHSPALALALVDNLLFKLLSGANASITVSSHPQPQTDKELTLTHLGPKGHYLSINLLFGIAFLSSSFSILTVTERRIKFKHIQFVSGVHVTAFWFSALLWDLISFLVSTLLLVVVFLYYKEEAFTHHESAPAVVLMLMLYGCAITPFIYVVSFFFDSAGSACVKLVIMLTFLKLMFSIPFTELGYTKISESLDRVFLILPGHCLGMAFTNLYYNFELKKFCTEGYIVQKNIYAWESLGMGKYLTALVISGPLYIFLLFLIETNVFRILKARLSDFSIKQNLVMLPNVTLLPKDQDVKEEAEIIETNLELLQKKNPLVVKDMSKLYTKKVPLLAVNQLSFTVQAKECFGLLGLNGAGKTSIFKMLTGEKSITSGDAFVKSLSVQSDLEKVRQWIGYCPQFDALPNFMTGREVLVMYARIRGIPECLINTCVNQLLEDLVMLMYADNLVKTYSGGNKRKLSTAIALIGEPAVIFLDEPSTGMDPVARRLLWDTVARARESGKAIVITSHSMEECEALCTRLAIMVQGQFKCLGSPQHLKSKFGSGYSLQAKVHREGQQEALQEFKAFVDLTFPGSILEDEHQGMVRYHLLSRDLGWAKVFGIMEQAKKKSKLEDYSINQISLEDIFLNLTSPVQAEPAGRRKYLIT